MLDLDFTVETHEFGKVTVSELKEGGKDIPVTDENKMEYVQLVAQFKMSNGIRKQIDAFLEGFHELIPPELISIFNEKELELLISGMPDIDRE
jgi:E3 ubiquitin-protein ligase HUWE1